MTERRKDHVKKMESFYQRKLRQRQAAYDEAVVNRLIGCSNCLGTTARLARHDWPRVSTRDLMGRTEKPLILGLSTAQINTNLRKL